MGWIHIESSDPAGSANGICVLSRIPLVRCVPQSAPIEIMSRWLDVDFVNQSFRLTAVHIPGEEKHRKRFFWNAVLTAAQHNVSRPFILMGDFNTGLHEIDETGKTFWFPELFKQLSTMGWVDGWRHFHGNSSLEPSWVSRLKGGAPGNPFRIDHAFLSPALLPRVRDCWYSHREREENISDHSMLLIQLDFDE
jgi:exonuclease III